MNIDQQIKAECRIENGLLFVILFYEIKPIKPLCQRGIAGLMGFMNGAY